MKNYIEDEEETKAKKEIENFINTLKNTEWDDRHRLIKALAKVKKSVAEHLILALNDTNKDVRMKAAWALGTILDERAVKPLNKALSDESIEVRNEAAWALEKLGKPAAEPHLQAIKDRDSNVRLSAVYALSKTFVNALDNEAASKEFLALFRDPESSVRKKAVFTICEIFPHLTDKEQATKELLALTKDEDVDVRRYATNALGSAFNHLENKETVIKNLLALTKDDVLQYTAEDTLSMIVVTTPFALRSTEEEKIIKYLLEFTKNDSSFVRSEEADASGSGITQVSDPEQDWKNLLVFIMDKDEHAGWRDAKSSGAAFNQVTDKERALKDLIALMKDKDSNVSRKAHTTLIDILIPHSPRNMVFNFECEKCGSVIKHVGTEGINEITYKCDNCGYTGGTCIDILY
ncbi:MAG TPA: HEAT repeat domain-containing protein [candidate division Zixibacteria bacterium]|nr:HEAT repeat domain-containing protein [candidate division Zixibacteria bacterium]